MEASPSGDEKAQGRSSHLLVGHVIMMPLAPSHSFHRARQRSGLLVVCPPPTHTHTRARSPPPPISLGLTRPHLHTRLLRRGHHRCVCVRLLQRRCVCVRAVQRLWRHALFNDGNVPVVRVVEHRPVLSALCNVRAREQCRFIVLVLVLVPARCRGGLGRWRCRGSGLHRRCVCLVPTTRACG